MDILIGRETDMTLLVTSANGANGAGYGKILAFGDDGKLIGVFGDDPHIADPRGLGIDRIDRLLFVNSGSNRILAPTTTEWSYVRVEL
jgi:hypothetical protein